MSPIRVVCAHPEASPVSLSARRVAPTPTDSLVGSTPDRVTDKQLADFPQVVARSNKNIQPARTAQNTRPTPHCRNPILRLPPTRQHGALPAGVRPNGALVRVDGVSARRRFAGRGLLDHGWHRWVRRARRHVWLRHVGSCSTELVSRLCVATPPHGAMLCRIRCTHAVVWLRWAVPGHERRPPL